MILTTCLVTSAICELGVNVTVCLSIYSRIVYSIINALTVRLVQARLAA